MRNLEIAHDARGHRTVMQMGRNQSFKIEFGSVEFLAFINQRVYSVGAMLLGKIMEFTIFSV